MSEQIPLCMIGDSITWANHGDLWRQELLRRIPALAFVGTHAGVHGYGHAGEGGNSTSQILARLDALPDCAHYALLAGTNDNNLTDPAAVPAGTGRTAANLESIVLRLLQRASTRRVFLGSILPCHSDDPAIAPNPLRDQANQAVNALLRARIASGALPADQITWVEYEHPIRRLPDWRETIRLHPLPASYAVLADILAASIRQTLDLADPRAIPDVPAGSGVEVVNLLDQATRRTREPVIAGWYTLSLRVEAVASAEGVVTLGSAGQAVGDPLRVPAEAVGRRIEREVFTGYEGHGYTRGILELAASGCTVGDLLLEKRRPSGRASAFGEGRFVDRHSPPAPGELLIPPPTRGR